MADKILSLDDRIRIFGDLRERAAEIRRGL
jgi:hypothetical protein